MPVQLWHRMPVALQAALLQVAALPFSLLLLRVGNALPLFDTGLLLALLQGAVAALFSHLARLPRWWLPIQAVFWPLLYTSLDRPQLAALAPFALQGLLLVFGNVVRERVPLFLSSTRVESHLAGLVAPLSRPRILDLGCGTGGLVRRLQRNVPAAQVEGIESAFGPWSIAWLAGKLMRSPVRVRYGDFWSLDLRDYDVVYAYLSPAPMARLWRKVQREMPPGSLFISNTFGVPDCEPDRVEVIPDWNDSNLLIWRIPDGNCPS